MEEQNLEQSEGIHDPLEKLEKESSSNPSWGGVREGSGRKKGKESDATIARREALNRWKENVVASTDKLFSAGISTALGLQFLIKVIEVDGMKSTCIVTDMDEILAYFRGETDTEEGTVYYYLTTQKPNLKAIDSMLDRTYGKAKESIDVNDKRKTKLVINIVKPDGDGNPSTSNDSIRSSQDGTP